MHGLLIYKGCDTIVIYRQMFEFIYAYIVFIHLLLHMYMYMCSNRCMYGLVLSYYIHRTPVPVWVWGL